jgi:DNA-directed RNA polymerase subunit beta'
VLGCYYLTISPRLKKEDEDKPVPACTDPKEVFLAYGHGKLGIHSRVKVRFRQPREVLLADDRRGPPGDRPFETTVGRIVFNDILPEGMPFYNYELKKRA